jgi:L-aspartate semialdehyde sulfurtransferase ferredoxin
MRFRLFRRLREAEELRIGECRLQIEVMATKKKLATGQEATTLDQEQRSRFWLMYPPKLIQRPLLWELAQKFKLVTNVRQASITDQIGLVCLELDGKRAEIKGAVRWLEKQGVKVEPLEINVIES